MTVQDVTALNIHTALHSRAAASKFLLTPLAQMTVGWYHVHPTDTPEFLPCISTLEKEWWAQLLRSLSLWNLKASGSEADYINRRMYLKTLESVHMKIEKQNQKPLLPPVLILMQQ